MRLAISPQARPSGAPRRIRRTLYWLGDRSSALSTGTRVRESRSLVRINSRNVVSSGQAGGRRLIFDGIARIIVVITMDVTRWNKDAGTRARLVAGSPSDIQCFVSGE